MVCGLPVDAEDSSTGAASVIVGVEAVVSGSAGARDWELSSAASVGSAADWLAADWLVPGSAGCNNTKLKQKIRIKTSGVPIST